MRLTVNGPALLSGLAVVSILVGCGTPPDAPNEPTANAELKAGPQPQASIARKSYDLSAVPKAFFAAPGSRAPRGFGASPALSPGMLATLASTLHVVNGSFEHNGGVGSDEFAGWTVVDFPEGTGGWLVQTDAAS